MGALTRDDFRNPKRVRTQKVDLSPWMGDNDYVWVRPISAKDLRDLRDAEGSAPELSNLGFVDDLLSRSLCDEDGALLFEDKRDFADSFLLPPGALNFLAEEVLRVSGIGTTEKN